MAKRKSSLKKGGSDETIFSEGNLCCSFFCGGSLFGFILFVCVVSGHLNHGTKLKSLCKDLGNIEKKIYTGTTKFKYCDKDDSEMNAIKTQIYSSDINPEQKAELISKLNEIEEERDNWGEGVQFKCMDNEDRYKNKKCYAGVEYGSGSVLKTSEQAWDDNDFHWPIWIVVLIGAVMLVFGLIACFMACGEENNDEPGTLCLSGCGLFCIGLILLVGFLILNSMQT